METQIPLSPEVATWLNLEKNQLVPKEQLYKQIDLGIQNIDITNQGKFDSLVDELIALGFPSLCIALFTKHNERFPHLSFKVYRALGISYMILSEFELSQKNFEECISLAPSEVPTYVNLIKVLIAQQNFLEAQTWIEKALIVEKNYPNLWETIDDFFIQSTQDPSKQLENLASLYNSWCGYSLAAERNAVGDYISQLKVDYFEKFYNQGERSIDFLVEYTAHLGVIGKFDSILNIINQKTALEKSDPNWKLCLHELQALISLHKKDLFLKKKETYQAKNIFPDQAQEMLAELSKEIDFNSELS